MRRTSHAGGVRRVRPMPTVPSAPSATHSTRLSHASRPGTVTAHSWSVSAVATLVTAATWSQHRTPVCATFELAGRSSNAVATRADSAADGHPIPNRNASHAVIDRDPSSRHPSWAMT